MSATHYSKTKDGSQLLTPHFKIIEFACRDGSDEILLDPALPPILEDIRIRIGNRSISVNSGYRTAAYNKKIGGATNSYHIKGMAADIAVSGVKPADVAAAAEQALSAAGKIGGIGLYATFVHVDTRTSKWRQDMVTGRTVSGFGPATPASRSTLRQGSGAHADVLELQERLNKHGASLAEDGLFGAKTGEAVRAFQSENNLTVDGIVGQQTWFALYD